MSKKNTRKVNLRASLLLLLVTAVILVTSSYAWFTANQTVSINTLNVEVQASNGLQLSADAITWKPTLTNTDLTGAHATYTTSVNQIPATMVPVSTSGGVTGGDLDMFLGSIGQNSNRRCYNYGN